MIHNAPIIPIIASILTYFIWCTLSEAAATACLIKNTTTIFNLIPILSRYINDVVVVVVIDFLEIIIKIFFIAISL